MAFLLLLQLATIAFVDTIWPRKAKQSYGVSYTELTSLSVPLSESAVD
jgi:hypothetical protein